MPERFAVDPDNARTEHLAAAGGVVVVVPMLLWLTGVVRHPALLAAAAVAAALVVYLIAIWRDRREGLLWLEIGDEGLDVARRDGHRRLPWSEITRAARASYGRSWIFTVTGRRHIILRLDALSPADATRASKLIGEHLRQTGVRERRPEVESRRPTH